MPFNAEYHELINIGLYLCRSEMASFFRPAVDSILRVIQSQRDGARTTPSVSEYYYCPEVDGLRLLP